MSQPHHNRDQNKPLVDKENSSDDAAVNSINPEIVQNSQEGSKRTMPNGESSSEAVQSSSNTNPVITQDEQNEQNEQDAQTVGQPEGNAVSFGCEKILYNRALYLSFAFSLVSPIINFIYHMPFTEELGFTLSLIIWVLFGVYWCRAFAMIMGPFFLFIAEFILLLDVIPALGTSLWVFLSNLLMVMVLNDNTVPLVCLKNLPLYSLIYANFILAIRLYGVQNIRALRDDSYYYQSRFSFRGSRYCLQDGKCYYDNWDDSGSHTWRKLKRLSVPSAATLSYHRLRNNACKYIKGDNMHTYQSDFSLWKTQSSNLVLIMNRRRFFCIIGFLFEFLSIYLSIHLVGSINLFRKHEHEHTFQDSLISFPKIVMTLLPSMFSHYLWYLFEIENFCTTEVESLGTILNRLRSSWIDWSDRNSEYLMNGKRLRKPFWIRGFKKIHGRDLPMIGITKDVTESEVVGQTVLRSDILSPPKLLVCTERDENVVRLRDYNPIIERQILLSEGGDEIRLEELDLIE